MTAVVDALLVQHISGQWRDVLIALAAEFESQLNHRE